MSYSIYLHHHTSTAMLLGIESYCILYYIHDHATAMLASAFTVYVEWQPTHYITATSRDTVLLARSTSWSQLDVCGGEVHTLAHHAVDLYGLPRGRM